MSSSKIASLAVGLLGLFVIVNALPLIQSLVFALLPKSVTQVEIPQGGLLSSLSIIYGFKHGLFWSYFDNFKETSRSLFAWKGNVGT